MRRFHNTVGTVILFLMILVSACAPRSEPVIAEGPPLLATSEATTEPALTEAPAEATEAPEEATEAPTGEPSGNDFEDFSAANFDNPTNVTNQWFPLKPGMQYIYEGITNDDEGNQVSRRLVVTVTDLTKVIDGVNTVVSWDRDYNDDSLVEAELAFYAQDNNGTVWRMGEHPEEYDTGTFITAPTWFSGIADSVAGIEMQGDPQLEQIYSQGWAPSVEFTDRGQVSQMDQDVCVPTDCYKGVVVIDETSKAEPDAHQFKYYAPSIGNIKVGWAGEDETKEKLELVEVKQLSADELAEAHAEALKEEQHAYEVSKDVYGATPPMK
jgi:hypothetical protein